MKQCPACNEKHNYTRVGTQPVPKALQPELGKNMVLVTCNNCKSTTNLKKWRNNTMPRKNVLVQYEQYQGQAQCQERVEKRREFVSGLLDFLKAKHPNENVHVWINDMHYLGCFIWGYAMHWRWGASDMSTKEVHRISKTAKVVRLASSKPVPQYSGLAA